MRSIFHDSTLAGAEHGAHWKTTGPSAVVERTGAGRTGADQSIPFSPARRRSSGADHFGVRFRREQPQHCSATGRLESDGAPLAQEVVRSGSRWSLRRSKARPSANPRRRADRGIAAHRPREQARRWDALDRALCGEKRQAFRKARLREPWPCSACGLIAPGISSCPPIPSSLTRSGTSVGLYPESTGSRARPLRRREDANPGA